MRSYLFLSYSLLYSTINASPVWRTIWSMRVPAKVKIHCWRSLWGAIPCQGVLANRHMQNNSQCPLCTLDCESICHAYFQCPRVKEVWEHLGMTTIISDACTTVREGSSVLGSLLLDRTAKAPLLPEVSRAELISTTIWYVWWECRQVTHGETIRQPVRTAQSISALVTNYARARKREHQGIARHGWVKPNEGYVKLNVDTSFNPDRGTGATGSIIRDEKGFFVAGRNCILPFVEDAYTAEACALRDGMSLAESMGCNKLIVHSDCSEVIEVMRNGGNTFGPAAAIFEDCIFFCRSGVH